MKQTITIRRTESRTYQLEVPQPLTRETLLALANERLASLNPEGFGQITGHSQGEWSLVKLSPECECQAPATSKKKGKR